MIIAIVPAYNEKETIGSVVRNLFQHVDSVVVVDDGSNDGTFDEASRAGAVVISHEINRGQGAALETGHSYARELMPDYIIHFDADAQFDAEDIPGAIRRIKESGADILFGSRFLGGQSAVPWMKRKIILPFARFFQKLFFGIRLTDAHNGFRVLGPKAFRAVRITQDRMAHATEILAQAKRLGLKIAEYPVNVSYREYGQGIAGGARIFQDLFFGKFIK